jgi:CHAT domain-containing protein
VSKAEALRRAQAQLIQSLRAQHREHPYYWAPYLMIGNWL